MFKNHKCKNCSYCHSAKLVSIFFFIVLDLAIASFGDVERVPK